MSKVQAELITCTSPAELLPHAADILATRAGEEWCAIVPRAHLARELRKQTMLRLAASGWTGPRVLTLEQALSHYARFIPGGQALTPLQSRQIISTLVLEAHHDSAGSRFSGQVVEGRVSDATLKALVHLFSELEPHAISAEDMRARLQEGTEARAVSQRALEISSVYEKYLERLAESGHQGPLGASILATEAARAKHPPEGARRFLFLGFDSASPSDIGTRLMLSLLANKEVEKVVQMLVVPDELESSAWSAHGNDALLDLWRERTPSRRVLSPDKTLSTRPVDIQALALDPSAYRLTPSHYAGGVSVVRVPDMQVEIEWIANDIKRRILTENIRPEEFGIVARDMGRRAPDFERALQKLGIPCVGSQENCATEVPAVRALLILYRLVAYGWKPADVVAAAESPYLSLGLNPTLLSRIGGSGTTPQSADEWQERIDRMRDNASEQAAQRGDLPGNLQARLAEEAASLSSAFNSLRETLSTFIPENESASPEAWIESLPKLLSHWEMESRIYTLSDSTDHMERATLVRTDIDALNALLRTANDWARGRELAGEAKTLLDARSWYSELEIIAREAKIRISTYPTEAVHLADPSQAALMSWQVVYLAGLVDGVFPSQLNNEEHSLTDAERRALSLPTAEQRSARERLLFHMVAAAAEKQLILLAPAADDRGKALVTSAFLTCLPLRVTGIVPREITARSLVPHGEEDVFSAADVEMLAAERLRHGNSSDDLVQHWLGKGSTQRALHGWYVERSRQEVEQAQRDRTSLESCEGKEFSGVLDASDLPEQVKRTESAFSPSELNQFDSCRFRYFASRVLGLSASSEKEDDHDEAAAFGTLQHRILERLYKELQEQGKLPPRGEAEIEEALKQLEEVARQELESHAASAHQRLWALDLEFVLDVLRLFVRRDLAGMMEAENESDSLRLRTRLRALEMSVGNAAEPVEIDHNGVNFRLRGVLDRVEVIDDDRLPEKAQGTLIIKDYKSTRSEWALKPENFISGRSIQLPLYSVLAEKRFGVPVFGFGELRTSQSKDPEPLLTREMILNDQGIAELARGSSLGNAPVKAAQETALDKAAQLVTDIRSGNFAPQPGRSCFGCPLKDVCRSSLIADPARQRERAHMPVAVSREEIEEARKSLTSPQE